MHGIHHVCRLVTHGHPHMYTTMDLFATRVVMLLQLDMYYLISAWMYSFKIPTHQVHDCVITSPAVGMAVACKHAVVHTRCLLVSLVTFGHICRLKMNSEPNYHYVNLVMSTSCNPKLVHDYI